MIFKLFLLFMAVFTCSTKQIMSKFPIHGFKSPTKPCDDVCMDLPKDDLEPVCMMFSRYKRGYQHFVNLCHARRTICSENLVLHMVHPSRCMKSGQFYIPVN